jgi:glutamate synthase (ferredoxin)
VQQTMISAVRYHNDFLEAQPFAETTSEQQAGLRGLIEEHVKLAHSKLGERLLADWPKCSANFILFTPKPQA